MKKTAFGVTTLSDAQKQSEITPITTSDLIATDYIPFGSDNLFPQALSLFSRLSPNHRGVINSKKVYTFGKDIISKEKPVQDFLQNCNFEKERLYEVLKRLEHDYLATGNGYLEVITDARRSYLFLNQIDSTKVRVKADNSGVLIHPNWRNYSGRKDHTTEIPFFPEFKKDGTGPFAAYRSVFHLYSYEPEFDFYGIPSWISGKDSVQLDFRTNRWNLARITNAFKISGMLFVPVKDAAESKQVLDHVKNEHTGDGNQDKLMVLTKSRARENEKADQVQLIQNQREDRGDWLELHKLTISDIIVAHSWYRSLTSLSDNTGFETNRILNEYNVALSTYILPRQNEIRQIINKITLETIGTIYDFQFLNEAPVESEDGMFIWEIRQKRGLPFNPGDPLQQKIIYNGSIIG